ncbi:hypothetical protein [Phyllobacterium endophyticum]|uniref:Uncharacterized protein n=1 Tax=Phyllobacterium endophyticum TaxID=1149773 RepID=A0A2P7AL04_9HYPH|nr:hypothetical protein [Phyllobacterium endophyticum]MBB3233224.1 hypothetical protein [Phyllobacterium endophyticum]PSH54884.1 hypothetical protein CU100_25270 [Phyllobacterium endophyticum]TYR43245.1 hypothetical protein FY050_05710 [Phyllobacterium endophyticum]
MSDEFNDDELVEQLRKMSEERIKEEIKREKTHANELAKYKAAAADRMSTAAIAVGFFGPSAAIVLNPDIMINIDVGRSLLLIFATCIWFVLFSALHNLGRLILRKELE